MDKSDIKFIRHLILCTLCSFAWCAAVGTLLAIWLGWPFTLMMVAAYLAHGLAMYAKWTVDERIPDCMRGWKTCSKVLACVFAWPSVLFAYCLTWADGLNAEEEECYERDYSDED